jgi:hypothetical protein
MIVGRSDISTLEKRDTGAPHPTAGRDSEGYGRKIPTRWMVKLPEVNRWRRVYVCCISNAGTAYVTVGKGWHVIEGSV